MAELLRPVKSRLANILARGYVTLVDDRLKTQGLQISLMHGEPAEAVEHFQPYGFTYKPHPGAEVLAVFVSGDRGHGIALGVGDKRYRIRPLVDGEVAIYTDEDGNEGKHRIHLKRGRVISIKCDVLNIDADTAININSHSITLTAEGTLTETSSEHRISTGDYEASQK
ncbi:phage baseplate assembly protein V [Sneathiella sp.]|uniref:phage baseplate assembly protein V n=1 Tax=Sneathiella sp. TaxID=1964365 RepID=UPI002FE19C54